MKINKFKLLCSCVKCQKTVYTVHLSRHSDRCGSCNQCANCGKEIPHRQRYCSRSCAGIVNSSKRTAEDRKRHGEKVSQTMKSKSTKPTIHGSCVLCNQPYATTNARQNMCTLCSDRHSTPSRIRLHAVHRHCPSCGKFEYTFGKFQKDTCASCRPLVEYRALCKFSHNLKDYPTEYNLSLLAEVGMFHPKTNPTGASRDHLYSVSDGHSNKIDPSIIRHPANCQIVTQCDNTRKGSRSSISLSDLLLKIADWDSRYSQ